MNMGWSVTKTEIPYPIAPTPQGYQTQGDLGVMLGGMFGVGKKQSMTSKMRPITSGDAPDPRKRKRK